ncbi:riboflavin synthase subunit beta [Patiriisocius hiemis]|uniref:Riboflavin synthase subunit beta n=1 Tax=Patiriisocius hiemis TaxID=3075604 RepID=A0ABU2Y9M3_9FLAO|nr:riboflavin synthase subunit beta [Constantimarinum sp. W242]MDT0554447.1 riboflavin synthase subunit beta [Constantimarinum sp. W242]
MGLISKRKNKKFSYSPRYYKSDKEGSPFEIEHKFDKYRTTVGKQGLKSNFKTAWQELRESKNKRANRTILIIFAIFLLIFLFIIEFDLSIFFQGF